jgi:hypothetical protein
VIRPCKGVPSGLGVCHVSPTRTLTVENDAQLSQLSTLALEAAQQEAGFIEGLGGCPCRLHLWISGSYYQRQILPIGCSDKTIEST